MEEFILHTEDNQQLAGSKWLVKEPVAVVCLVHGMSEYMHYYERFALFLNQHQVSVYGFDHRGHGRSVSSDDEIGHIGDEDAFDRCASDVSRLVALAKNENPQSPLFLLGHSMGSLICRLAVSKYTLPLHGLLVTGIAAHPGVKGIIGLPFIRLMIWLRGKTYRSVLVEKLVFGILNKKFKPLITAKDWLSREERFLREFTADPKCNKVFTVGFYHSLGKLAFEVNKPTLIATYDKHIPWFIFSGSEDAIGNFSKGVKAFFEKLTKAGIQVEMKIYEGGRHVMLNETNKEEVYGDVLSFIRSNLKN